MRPLPAVTSPPVRRPASSADHRQHRRALYRLAARIIQRLQELEDRVARLEQQNQSREE